MDDQATQQTTEARETFERDVYTPAFVEKCAELGVTFPDEDSLGAALDTVRHIKTASAQQSVDLTKSAHSDLMAAMGLARPEETVAEEQRTEKAAEAAKEERLKAAYGTLVAAGQPSQ